MTLNDALHDGETGAGSFILFLAVEALKNAEQLSGIVHIKARAVIPDKIDGLGIFDFAADFDQGGFLLACKLDGVG